MVLALSGCQLALPFTSPVDPGDTPIGVFMTLNPLVIHNDDPRGRLYSPTNAYTFIEAAQKNFPAHLGNDFPFEGVSGMALFAPFVPASKDSLGTVWLVRDLAVSDQRTDEGSSEDDTTYSTTLSIAGTIYFSMPAHNYATFFWNPVYQTPQGRVYVVPGDPPSDISIVLYDSEGTQGSFCKTEDATTTEGGRTQTSSTKVTVNFSAMFAPQQIVIVQMGKDDSVISRTQYVPGLLPDTLTLQPHTAYFIVETHRLDSQGKESISRAVYAHDTSIINTYSERDDGMLIRQETDIVW